MSKVNVRVAGVDAPKTSIDITYGVNIIPTATIGIDPTRANDFIASIEARKRSPVNISIQSSLGDLSFSGLLEGISLSQSPGSLSCDVYVKNQFQRLLEIYPRVPGVNPSSVDIFRRTELLSLNLEDNAFGQLVMNSVKIDVRRNIIDFVKELLIVMLQLQNDPARNVQTDYAELTQFTKLLEGSSYKDNLAAARQLVQRIDTSATSDCICEATQLVQSLIKPYLFGSDTLWDTLVGGLADLNCCIVVGNNRAFILPQNNFIKAQHTQPALRQKQGNIPNFAPPASFSNFVFDTSSYRDIGKVWLIASTATAGQFNSNTYNNIGYFEDPQAKASGVHVEMLPNYFLLPVTDLALQNGVNRRIADAEPNITEPVTPEQAEALLISQQKKANDQIEAAQRKFGNQMAEIVYYKQKYTDKTGSFTTEFNPNWVPGTTGTLYTRFPGFFLDFYVTNVTHRISLNAPNNGTALTSVTFCAGRSGVGDSVAGVESDPFFNYNRAKMQAIQNAFIADITST